MKESGFFFFSKWEQQEEKEEDVASAKDTFDRLEEELWSLKEIVTQQAEILQAVGSQLRQRPKTENQVVRTKVNVKPKDVPLLNLSQLEGIKALGTLSIFYDVIEQVTDDDKDRVRVTKTRLSLEMALLLQNYQSKGKCRTWAEVKEFFRTEFVADVNCDRALQEIEKQVYDWGESPQAFTNRIICRYAVLESRFPQEKLSDRNQVIKRKLWRGLPCETREKAGMFFEDEISPD